MSTPLRTLLRERRRQLGLNTIQAAERCGLSQPVYSRYENGRPPTDDNLDKLAAFLGITRAEAVLARSADYLGDEAPAGDVQQLREEVAALRSEVARLLDRIPDTG